jgi:hypothetical protein
LGGAGLSFVVAVVASSFVRTAQADPPADQTYVGVKRCASCHLDQFMAFKKTKHAKAFEVLTAKYEKDAKCLKCHTTGFGESTGYKDESTAALAGVTCEKCHGPGSKHEEIGQKYAKVKTLTEGQTAELKGSIWKVMPKNVCVECHVTQAHKKSETPPELRPKG